LHQLLPSSLKPTGTELENPDAASGKFVYVEGVLTEEVLKQIFKYPRNYEIIFVSNHSGPIGITK
jgi:isocitrate dehydrogenase